MRYDVAIIGAGAVGCAIARELSFFKLKVAVLEKSCDVAFGTSGRNSAVCHAGFNNKTTSLMARFCVEGNRLMEGLCQDLGVEYRKTGKFLIGFDEADMRTLEALVEKGKANGCTGLQIVGMDAVHAKVPGVGGIGAMSSPNTAIFDTFGYTVALAENAKANGCDFYFSHAVKSVAEGPDPYRFIIDGAIEAKVLINSAGLFADKVSSLCGVDGYRIYPCKGQYYVYDKIADSTLQVPVYPAPRPGIGGLGIHLTPTIHGNVIAGPSADYQDDPEDYCTTKPVLDQLLSESSLLLGSLRPGQIIASYAGIRPKQAPPSQGGFMDFTIKAEQGRKGLVNLIGIESPGLTASVPIAMHVRDILIDHQRDFGLDMQARENPIRTRKAPVRFASLDREEQARLIKENPDYGTVVCRCQTVTLAEIKKAIDNVLGCRSIASVKYRAWPTTGRCQGGYCMTRIVAELMKSGLKAEEINLRDEGSNLFWGQAR
ncbi:MAG: NAD(P)/FAD-dependent oxidoreductase [Sphaerochaetaceae bacterium]